MNEFSDEIKKSMQLFFSSLPEKSRRHYAAIESKKLGYRGVTFISELLDIDRSTIHEGLKELNNVQQPEKIYSKKQRQLGGGRKKKL